MLLFWFECRFIKLDLVAAMDYKTSGGLKTSDHVGCFRFADWLILWFKMAATEWDEWILVT